MTQLQALQNAANSTKLEGLNLHEQPFNDKRRTTPMFFLSLNGTSISPVLNYDNMNHFILGFARSNEILRKELLGAFIAEIKKEFTDENWDYLEFIKDRVLKNE